MFSLSVGSGCLSCELDADSRDWVVEIRSELASFVRAHEIGKRKLIYTILRSKASPVASFLLFCDFSLFCCFSLAFVVRTVQHTDTLTLRPSLTSPFTHIYQKEVVSQPHAHVTHPYTSLCPTLLSLLTCLTFPLPRSQPLFLVFIASPTPPAAQTPRPRPATS